jgi:hypothetical protein
MDMVDIITRVLESQGIGCFGNPRSVLDQPTPTPEDLGDLSSTRVLTTRHFGCTFTAYQTLIGGNAGKR